MNINTAIIELKNYLNNPDWIRMIGIEEQYSMKIIVVYVKNPLIAQHHVPTIWQSFPVVVKKLSKPIVATKI